MGGPQGPLLRRSFRVSSTLSSLATDPMMLLLVSHHGVTYELETEGDGTETLEALKARLEQFCGVRSKDQRLVYKGSAKFDAAGEQLTVGEAGLSDGMKIMLLGPTTREKAGLAKGERTISILKNRVGSKPSSTSIVDLDSLRWCFGEVKPLLHPAIEALKNSPYSSDAALATLTRLAEDLSIKKLMSRHKLAADLLTELPPTAPDQTTSATLLGLNSSENGSRTIHIRLRAENLEWMRSYKQLRETLVHELVHNTIGPHNEAFNALNRQYLLEIEEFESHERQAKLQTTGGSFIETHRPLAHEKTVRHKTGVEPHFSGRSNRLVDSLTSLAPESVEIRRQKIREAAEGRLSRSERETVMGCGTAPPGKAAGL